MNADLNSRVSKFVELTRSVIDIKIQHVRDHQGCNVRSRRKRRARREERATPAGRPRSTGAAAPRAPTRARWARSGAWLRTACMRGSKLGPAPAAASAPRAPASAGTTAGSRAACGLLATPRRPACRARGTLGTAGRFRCRPGRGSYR